MSARPKLRLVQPAKRRGTRPKYLQEPDATGSWRFRRLVPKKLREVIGKGEWTETLKARTENEAIRLLLPHVQETDRIIALAEAGNWPPIPDEDVETVATAWWMGEPGAQTMSSPEVPRSVERFLVGPRSLGKYDTSPLLEWGRAQMVAILDKPQRNAAFRRNPDAMARLIRECRRYIAVRAMQKGLVEPFDVIRPTDAAATVLAVIPASAPVVFPSLSLGVQEAPDGSDLISKWAKEARPDARWLYQSRLTMRKLGALVGHDDATRVTRADVIQFKEGLVAKNLRAPTINRYLNELRGPFKWAFDNQKIGTDPSAGVVFASKVQGKGRTKRKGYTDEQARLILSAARDEEAPHLRWIPWIAAFTGTRLDEIAGRNVADIEKVGSYYVLNVREATEDGSVHVKNDGSVRKVPLHKAVIREGFIDYVETLPKDGPLFPDLKPDRFGRRAGAATKKIGNWLRRLQKETGVLLVEKGRYAPNHSWRHRFKSEARRVRMEEEVHDALTGHQEGGGRQRVSRDYGEYYIESTLGPAIDTMLSPFDIAAA